jgi:universal stress protein A
MQVKSILCPIDFSDFSAAAYQYAVSLSEYYKARILVLHVVELSKYPFADDVAQEADCAKLSRALNQGGVVQLQRFVKQYSADRIQPQLVIHQGNAANYILSLAQKENIEVMVVGTHGRRGFDQLALGSTIDRVMRKAACPMLAAGNASHQALSTGPDGRHRLSRIVYCTAFWNNSERARGNAISLAAEYGAELTMLHVAEKAPRSGQSEGINTRLTEELDKVVLDTERQNRNMRSVVRFAKALGRVCSTRNRNASRPNHQDCARRRHCGPDGFRLNYLSCDPVGSLPAARGPHLIDTGKEKVGFHG